jgi:hypothetical protein
VRDSCEPMWGYGKGVGGGGMGWNRVEWDGMTWYEVEDVV